MRIALYQCPPLPLDVPGNLKRLHHLAHEASGADLLVLEMFLTGYNIGAKAVSAWPRRRMATRRMTWPNSPKCRFAIVYGYPERAADGQIYNACS
jgi:predicted amidohydrolase